MEKIIIAGGGIGGLCTALALHKLGFEVEVYEKAPVLMPAGAGIVMAANARKVFRWLGIDAEVAQAGVPLEVMTITNPQIVPFRNTMNIMAAPEHERIVAIHRAALQDCFLRHLPEGVLRTGAAYVSHEEDAKGVRVRFSNGMEAEGHLLLGADGLRSKVREAIFPGAPLRYSGQTSWRGVVKHQILKEGKVMAFEAWGAEGRFGTVPITAEMSYWFAVQSTAEGGKDQGDPRTQLVGLFKGWHPGILDMIRATAPEAILRTDLSDLRRLAAWHKGRACLLGDAAHATTPNYGQGGAQAVEDAWYISNILARTANHEEAFRHFTARRRKKVDMIVNGSWQFGQLAHKGWGRFLMTSMMRYAPESMLRKQFDRLQAIDEHFEGEIRS